MTLRFLPIDTALADQVRRDLRSPRSGHAATVERAKGYGPCRQCLRTFRTGEEDRILFTYNPVRPADGLPDPGPVCIHKDVCAAFEGNELPGNLRALPLFLEGYGQGSWLVRRERVEAGDVEGAAARLFANPAMAYAQLRNAEAGCFIARVERDQPAGGTTSIEK